MRFLNDTVPFSKGFPFQLFVSGHIASKRALTDVTHGLQGDGSEYNIVFKAAGHYDPWPAQQSITPAQKIVE